MKKIELEIPDGYVFNGSTTATTSMGGQTIIHWTPKEPLLITEDGVKLYDKCDLIWTVKDNDCYLNNVKSYLNSEYGKTFKDYKVFSSEEKAKEYIEQQKLLLEAKKRYPVGTKFKSLLNYKYTVSNDSVFGIKGDYIIVDTYLLHRLSNNQWAETITNLPSSWNEYINNEKDTVINDTIYNIANKTYNLNRLLILRDVYRQGWKPDWSDYNQAKEVLFFERNKIIKDDIQIANELFSFQSKEIRDLFYNNFKSELEKLIELY